MVIVEGGWFILKQIFFALSRTKNENLKRNTQKSHKLECYPQKDDHQELNCNGCGGISLKIHSRPHEKGDHSWIIE